MKQSSLFTCLLAAIFLLGLLLGSAPAAAAQSPGDDPNTVVPTNGCVGTGYMIPLFLTQQLPRGDDTSGGPFPLGFTINYYGVNYNSVYINTNGHVDFGSSSNHYYLASGMASSRTVSIAPFTYDADTRPVGSPNLVLFDQVTVYGHPAFAVHWSQLGHYNQMLDFVNDFQLLIINRSDRAPGDFDIEFNYAQVQWDYNGWATSGLSDGLNGMDDFTVLGSGTPGTFLDSNPLTGAVHTAVNSPNCGQHIYQVYNGQPWYERWLPVSLDNIGCNGGDIQFTTNLDGMAFPTNMRFHTTVDVAGVRYMDEDAGVPTGGNGTYGWGLYYSNSGGPAAGVWPLPPNTPITVSFQLINGVGGGVITNQQIHLSRCNGGILMPTFTDVPPGHWANSQVYSLAAAGITTGCSQVPPEYCPGNTVTRAQMAKFLELGIRGPGYLPPAGTGAVFGDVTAWHWASGWIERLFADGITTGCGGGNYCPEGTVTRAQMAIFLLRARHGALYTPPPAAGIFTDVPTSHWAAAWIEQLYAEGITTGCYTSPLQYCPESPVFRDEMAVFLVRTFYLP